jgi:DNA-binding IscR family transcriptional regulator
VTLDEIYRITEKDVLKPKCHECSGCCTIGKNIEDVLDEIFLDADQNLQKYLKQYTLSMLLKRLKQA